MEALEPEIFQNGIWYKLCGEQYYPCLLPPEPENTEEDLLELIIQQMTKAQGIDENLKERDPLALSLIHICVCCGSGPPTASGWPFPSAACCNGWENTFSATPF